MALYWAAVDHAKKKYFESPSGFSIKEPGIYHYGNPFPCMVVMMNSRGCDYQIEHDGSPGCYYDRDYEDITEMVYKKLLDIWPGARDFYEKEQ